LVPIVRRDADGILQVSDSPLISVLPEDDLPSFDELVEELECIRTTYPNPARGYSGQFSGARYEDGYVSWPFPEIREGLEENLNDLNDVPDLV